MPVTVHRLYGPQVPIKEALNCKPSLPSDCKPSPVDWKRTRIPSTPSSSQSTFQIPPKLPPCSTPSPSSKSFSQSHSSQFISPSPTSRRRIPTSEHSQQKTSFLVAESSPSPTAVQSIEPDSTASDIFDHIVEVIYTRFPSIRYSELPVWTAPPANIRALARIPYQCVKVGGVAAETTPSQLCSLISTLFGVEPLDAGVIGVGLYVVALKDYFTNAPTLFSLTECFWMGPGGVACPESKEEATLLNQELHILAQGWPAKFPRHSMTFAPYIPCATGNSTTISSEIVMPQPRLLTRPPPSHTTSHRTANIVDTHTPVRVRGVN